jgi:hypothetical protein
MSTPLSQVHLLVDPSDAIAERWASARHETAIVRPNKNAELLRLTVEEKADSSETLISQNFMMVYGPAKSPQRSHVAVEKNV